MSDWVISADSDEGNQCSGLIVISHFCLFLAQGRERHQDLRKTAVGSDRDRQRSKAAGYRSTCPRGFLSNRPI
jgi:hypothetical protein